MTTVLKKEQNYFSYLSISSLLTILSTGCISCSSSFGLWIVTSIASVIGFGTATAFASFLSEHQTNKSNNISFIMMVFCFYK